VVREEYAFVGSTGRASSIENRTQTHGKLNGLTFPHTIHIKYRYASLNDWDTF
jgi:hypothetical protein